MLDTLFDYAAAQSRAEAADSNDYHILPPSEKQLSFAAAISARAGVALPDQARTDRAILSKWIERHRSARAENRYDRYPSSKQVRFAESIARRKRRDVPRECFRDKGLMSHWIDSNK